MAPARRTNDPDSGRDTPATQLNNEGVGAGSDGEDDTADENGTDDESIPDDVLGIADCSVEKDLAAALEVFRLRREQAIVDGTLSDECISCSEHVTDNEIDAGTAPSAADDFHTGKKSSKTTTVVIAATNDEFPLPENSLVRPAPDHPLVRTPFPLAAVRSGSWIHIPKDYHFSKEQLVCRAIKQMLGSDGNGGILHDLGTFWGVEFEHTKVGAGKAVEFFKAHNGESCPGMKDVELSMKLKAGWML